MKLRTTISFLLFTVLFLQFVILIPFKFGQTQALGNTFYVSTTGNNGNAGTIDSPWLTIQHAANNATFGDTVIIRGGTYNITSSIDFPNSGTSENPIIFRAADGETPVIDGGNIAANILNIEQQSYITFQGLHIRNPSHMWAYILESDHIVMEDMDFNNDNENEDRNFVGVAIWYSDYTVLRDSTLSNWGTTSFSETWGTRGNEDGNLVRIVGDTTAGMYNLLEDNYFGNGAQGGVLVNSPYNVVRNNTFENEWQKGIYVGWFNEPGDEPPGTVYEAVGNVIEGNQFIRSQESSFNHGGLGIEHTALRSIIRKNVIRNSDQIGFITTVFCDNTVTSSCNYAIQDYDNRIYNNTIVNNGLQAEAIGNNSIAFGGTGMELTNHGLTGEVNIFVDNVIKNNYIYDNLDNANNDPLQLNLQVTGAHNDPPYGGHVLAGNLIHNKASALCSPGNNRCPVYIPGSPNGTMDIATLNSISPSNFFDNTEIIDDADPGFVAYDPGSDTFDLHLEADSPAVDAGTDLTVTTDSGTAENVITVADSFYFFDGYGIVEGDEIMVGDQTVTITDVNYSTHELTVDQNISWDVSDPVNLVFEGAAPDAGAYEFGSTPTDVDNPVVGSTSYEPGFDNGVTIYVAPDSAFEATITDTTSSIADCEQSINSGGWTSATWTPDGDPTTGTCSGAFTLTSEDDGDTVTLTLRGTDTASNVGTGDTDTVTIDAVDPEGAVVIDNTSYNSATYTSSTIKGTASDTGSGVASVNLRIQRSSDNYYWNGTSWVSGSTTVPASTSNGYSNWNYAGLSSANLTDGLTYTVTADVTDNVDHTAQTTADSFAWEVVASESPAPSSNPGNSSSSSSSSPAQTPTCSDAAPTGTPDLFQIDINNKEATLYFTPVNQSNKYFIAFGEGERTEDYGVEFSPGQTTGVTAYTIQYLRPNTKYSFKVRSGNGCMPGNWGNTVPAQTSSSASRGNVYYKDFVTRALATFSRLGTRSVASNPLSDVPSLISGCQEYTVVPGNNLWNLALRLYGTGVRYLDIMTKNNLSSTIIRPGQVLTFCQ